ncbi:tRNA N(3)-methylcytidine methyltransferase METTL8, mitochondrial isoform X4 [Alexandromys fortis]|uniref:tRNA N(3)-methylcytidine methyltransferase METTL8, mitochondrial isoform X4 n=1 Tax=Alexandromys fortis TaxID=100897 RepID=UPI0021531E1D|nr:tRNA N(3)-methylcytidine methyltransferase METTL8, mitochondrial isoform X4 [Microtus fortis]
MNVIWRNCICRLRQGKAPHRCQSGVHPVAPLGSRILTDPAKVFEHNMWDHMQWSEEEEDAARKQVEENSATRVAPEEQVKFERDANKYWDTFYQTHKNKFFKNRNWLLREFPEILPVDQSSKEKVEGSSWDQGRSDFSNMQRTEKDCQKSRVSSAPWSEERSNFPNQDLEEHSEGPGKTERFPGSKATFRILEVGCGAGNCVFPIMNTLRRQNEKRARDPILPPSCALLSVRCGVLFLDTRWHLTQRAGIGAHTSLLILWYQRCWSNSTPTPTHPSHVRSLCLDSKSSAVVVLTTSGKAERDGDNTNVLLPAL